MRSQNWLTAILVIIIAGGAVAETPIAAKDWREQISDSPPGEFPLLPSCLLTFKISWNGLLKAGMVDAVLRNEETEGSLFVSAQARSTGPARLLWAYDASHSSWIDAERLLPIKVVQVEDDRRETNSYQTEFVGDFVFNKWITTPKADGKEIKNRKQRIFEQSSMHDLVSAALYLRSQALDEIGEDFSIVTFPFRDLYLVNLTFSGREKHGFDGQKIDALRFDMKLSKILGDGSLQAQDDKLHSATIWLSDDELRLPLELRSEIFVGNVKAALVNYQPLKGAEANPSGSSEEQSVGTRSISKEIRGRARKILERVRGRNE